MRAASATGGYGTGGSASLDEKRTVGLAASSAMTAPTLRAEQALERVRRAEIPFLLEIVLAWTAVLLFAARYLLGYAFLLLRTRSLRRRPSRWHRHVPLASLAQTESASNQERAALLQRIVRTVSSRTANRDASLVDIDDEAVVATVQSDLELRQLLSRWFVRQRGSETVGGTDTVVSRQSVQEQPHVPPGVQRFLQRVQRLWPQLLRVPPSTASLPSTTASATTNVAYKYQISVIVPVYRETLADIMATLDCARRNCSNPSSVQVVVVHAGGCSLDRLSVQLATPTTDTNWADVQVVQHRNGGGRGRSMNVGANRAEGSILTFLHADTSLPKHWNVLIANTLTSSATTNVTCCAFLQGIDITEHGLKGGRIPPGIRPACNVLGYLRCYTCKLPYGDSVLSFPAGLFRYLGGYPDQPLMEDFEIVSVLRMRALLLEDENIVVLPQRAYCSVRRWQTYGVVYTILANALCVHRYNHGTTADDLFDFYYRQRNTNVKQE